MALTRKMLSAMDIPSEKIDEIINAHTETVTAIKDERDALKGEIDTLKGKVKTLEGVEAKLTAANDEIKKFKDGDWEKKYNDLKGEFDTFKTDTEQKAIKDKKSSAYRKLLASAGVSEKRIDSVMKVSGSEIDAIEFDDGGNVKDADKLTESVKESWADFISDVHSKGADVANPPKNTGGDVNQPSHAAAMVAKFNAEHYGNKED